MALFYPNRPTYGTYYSGRSSLKPKEPTMSEYPQPEVVAPPNGTTCFFVDTTGNTISWIWDNYAVDKKRMANGYVYLSSESARARFDWNQHETKKRTIPAWFRALGPVENIEMKHVDGKWEPLAPYLPYDWTKVPQELFRTKPDWLAELGPEVEIRNDHGVWIPYVNTEYRVDHNVLRAAGFNFRAKRKPVVKEINGVRFSWPATVRKEDPKGPRYDVRYSKDKGHFVHVSNVWNDNYSPYVHETYDGANAQCNALIAMAQ